MKRSLLEKNILRDRQRKYSSDVSRKQRVQVRPLAQMRELNPRVYMGPRPPVLAVPEYLPAEELGHVHSPVLPPSAKMSGVGSRRFSH